MIDQKDAVAQEADADIEGAGFKVSTFNITDEKRGAALATATELAGIVRDGLYLCTSNGTQAGEVGCAIVGHMLDGYRACLHLINSPGEASAPSIVRIMLESFADLRALANDPTYVRRMMMHAARKRHRVVSDMLIAYKDDAPTVERATRENASLDAIIAVLTGEGAKGLSVAERFKLGDITSEQGFIYGDLSSHTHADFLAIMTRHSGHQNFQLGAPLGDQSFVQVLVIPTFILLDALLLMPKFAKVDVDKLNVLRERGVTLHNELRALI